MITFIVKKKVYFLSGVFLIFGISLGIIFSPRLSDKFNRNLIRQKSDYKFINPLLECDISAATEFKELTPFKHKVEKKIEEYKSKQYVNYVSIYFRDLNNGPWFGINEKDDFSPASLLKVPLMMAYYKLAENDPQILSKNLKYDLPLYDQKINISASGGIEQGKTYTVDELINNMIIYSDNNAKNLLFLNIDQGALNKAYSDLGIDVPNENKPEDFMSVKDYASFFRILFNASYLDKNLSEKALSLLSHIDFKNGLRSGVPENIPVSQKFGERAFDNINVKQLHDCGIIYYPNYPYLLCVMTRGNNFEYLTYVIKNISSLVFTEIDNQYKK